MTTLWLLSIALSVSAPPENPLATLRAGHPRLMLLDEQLPALRTAVRNDPIARGWHQRLRGERDKLLTAEPTEFRIVGPRLLSASRSVLGRVSTLALLYRLDGDVEAGQRAVAEMVAAAGWPHWNPSHFLDTAELNNAFGIGWDWLQPLLEGEQRQEILRGWYRHGILPALDGYRGERPAWWTRVTHNWNQVCNGGNAVAALALADLFPAEAAEIVSQAVEHLPRALGSYAPDGGWDEGPGYWLYATSYTVYVLSALQTALGTDFGLSDLPGMAETGDFRLHFSGPSRETFNYADAGSGVGAAPCLFWLGRRYNKPLYFWQEHQLSNGDPFDLAWYSGDEVAPERGGVPLDALFTGIDVGFFRGSWADPNTTWIGFKGGDNQANHSHLDLGTFVLDAKGQRFISELGGDDYNMPGYFGGQRWTYYRLRTEGQNTLLIDEENQPPTAKAQITSFDSQPARAAATVDLGAAYPMTQGVTRTFELLDRRDVLVVDEVTTDAPLQLEWAAHTAATVTVAGRLATLTRGGQSIYATVVGPASAIFEAVPVELAAPQRPANGITKLRVRYPAEAGTTRLGVFFSPNAAAVPPPAP